MSTGVIRISAALFALALLIGVAGLFTQPAQAVKRVGINSVYASVPSARSGADVNSDTTRPAVDIEGFHADGTTQLVNNGVLQTTGGVDVNIGTADDPETVTLGAVTNASTGVTMLTLADIPDDTSNAEETDDFATPLSSGDHKGDWLEVLTGPGAGKAGLIVKHEKGEAIITAAVPAVAADPDNQVVAVAAVPAVTLSYGTVTFDGTDGLSLDMLDLATDTVFRIVEQNPTNTVEFAITDDDGPGNDDDGDPINSFKITVESEAADVSMDYTFAWTSTDAIRNAAGEAQVVKFELVARPGGFGVRTLEVTGRGEPDNFWVGHSVVSGPEEGRVRRLITASTGSGVTTTPTEQGVNPVIEVIQVPAFEDQRVTLRYGIYRADVDTDKIGPIISNAVPGKGAVVQDGEILFQADVIDVSSGYSDDDGDMEDTPDQKELEIGTGDTERRGNIGQSEVQRGWIALEILGDIIAGDDPGMTWTEIDDGWRMTYRNSLGAPDVDTPIGWRIIARDQAGAQTVENHLTKSDTLLGNGVLVDGANPKLVPGRQVGDLIRLVTRTGDNWRASASAGSRWRAGGGDRYDTKIEDTNLSTKKAPATKGENRKGILVTFDEAGGLDVSTVDPSDFSVNGATPTSVTVVDVFEDTKADPDAKVRKPQEVFLTMANNLASNGKDANGDKLEVSLTGTIRDVAGNAASTGSEELADGIPPKITVVIDDADRFDQESIVVKVTVDETLNSAPKLTVRRSESTTLKTNARPKLVVADDGTRSLEFQPKEFPEIDSSPSKYDSDDNANVSSKKIDPLEMDSTGARAYEAEIDITDSATVPLKGEASLISIVVKAQDVGSNEEEVGDDDDWTQGGAFTFELDPELNNSMEPEFTVAGNQIFDGKMLGARDAASADAAEIEVVDPLLITVDFSRQCGDTAVTVNDEDKAGCVDGGEAKEYHGDTHKTIELSGLGVSVRLDDGTTARPEPNVSTSDNIIYTLSISNRRSATTRSRSRRWTTRATCR